MFLYREIGYPKERNEIPTRTSRRNCKYEYLTLATKAVLSSTVCQQYSQLKLGTTDSLFYLLV